MILTVGGDESPEYHRLQREYQELLIERGFDVQIVPQQGGHHFDAVDLLGDANGPLAAAVLRMIETCLKPERQTGRRPCSRSWRRAPPYSSSISAKLPTRYSINARTAGKTPRRDGNTA